MVSSEASTIESFRTATDEAGTAPEDRRFRPDVQGLRAVAVVLVVLFHAHVPTLTGGYVGVDVFFVISGFVITGVLLRERASTGSNSIVAFYGRRARRIIPAATLVIITAVIASYVVLGPLSGGQTAGDARWASVFLINVHFSHEGTNYLSSLLPPSVLQNYWSLAVEEQFYLVYPAVFVVVAGLWRQRSLRCRLGLMLAIALAGSLAESVVMTSNDPNTAYFSTVPRIWELALGGLVAVGTVGLRRVPMPLASTASWLGLGLILVAAFVFTPATSYPGSAVILPVVGAALVIAGGVAEPDYGVEVLLRLRPFQWLGLISYSLYLWHWPILTMAAERRGGDSLPVTQSLGWGRGLGGPGHRDLPGGGESGPPQSATSFAALVEPGFGRMPHRVEPGRGHHRNPRTQPVSIVGRRLGWPPDECRMPFSDHTGACRPAGYGASGQPASYRPDPGGR